MFGTLSWQALSGSAAYNLSLQALINYLAVQLAICRCRLHLAWHMQSDMESGRLQMQSVHAGLCLALSPGRPSLAVQLAICRCRLYLAVQLAICRCRLHLTWHTQSDMESGSLCIDRLAVDIEFGKICSEMKFCDLSEADSQFDHNSETRRSQNSQ